ncbi:MAG: ABC transporter ATP-binding protein [Acidimicrobiales bacterium]
MPRCSGGPASKNDPLPDGHSPTVIVYGQPIATIHIAELSHAYRNRSAGDVPVLRGVSLEVDEGEYVALVGPSGSGKTTLLCIIGGLERPQTGAVRVCGEDLSRLSGDEMAVFRRQSVGFVFQHFGLLDALTALENVELALVLSGRGSARARRDRAQELLERVGLGKRLGHRPSQLSGGERQRVAIARALANEPRLILADEPTGNLDDESSVIVGDLLDSVRQAEGCTLVVVTHHHALADRADRRLALADGALRPMTRANL